MIEIADSATYASSGSILISNPAIRNLTIRAAAGQRPCLTFYSGPAIPTPASFDVRVPMSTLELNGLLISGGSILVRKGITQLRFKACTLDPGSPSAMSLISVDNDRTNRALYILHRCITGGLALGSGVDRITLADSIVDQRSGLAISNQIGSPPGFSSDLTVQSGTRHGLRSHPVRSTECQRMSIERPGICCRSAGWLHSIYPL